MNAPLAIRHIDLREAEPPGIEQGITCDIFWWGYLPLGMHLAHAEQRPYGQAQLQSFAKNFLAEQLAAREPELGAPLLATHEGKPKRLLTLCPAGQLDGLLERANGHAAVRIGDGSRITIIVCTRDRRVDLERCLASIQSQLVRPKEIIIVDNSANGSARDCCSKFDDITYVHEPRPGLSVARNAGIGAASGEIIAFTDDDAEVHPHWIAEIAYAFDNRPIEAMTGLVLPASLDTPAQRFFQFEFGGFGNTFVPTIFDSQFFDETRPYGAQVWNIGAGANMAFRRSAFERAGLFDERLGAGASGCSEDSEFWYRLLAHGGEILFEPRAVVHHHHRDEWRELKKQSRSYMQGHVSALIVQYDKFGDRGNMSRIFRQIPVYLFRVIRRSTFRRNGHGDMYRAQFKGWLSGLAYLFRRRWRQNRSEQVQK